MKFITPFSRNKRSFLLTLSILMAVLTHISPLMKMPVAQASSSSKASIQTQYFISETIGRDQSGYHINKTQEGGKAENETQNLTVNFTSSGVIVQSNNLTWNMGLKAWGTQESLNHVLDAELQINANQATYLRQGISEWYINGPGGLQQGFTVTETEQNLSNQLILQLDLPEGVKANLNENRTGLTFFNLNGSQLLTYSGLLAYDAENKTLPAKLEIDSRNQILQIIVDTENAAYPITIDPWTQTAKLEASDQDYGDQFGWSVAISGDVIAVGANKDGDSAGGDSDAGSVYVFVKPGTGWTNTSTYAAKLTASDRAPYDEFGSAVAIDGKTIIVGTPGDESDTGAAYVFEMPVGGWAGNLTETAKLTASGSYAHPGDEFGCSVAIDGDTITVGAKGDVIPSGWKVGAAYVFVKPAGGWASMTESARLTSTGSMHQDEFGASVGVSGDMVIAGAPRVDLVGAYSGSVYVFDRPVGGWTGSLTPDAVLVASDSNVYVNLGHAVDIDDDTILAGAYGDSLRDGAAYIFEKGAAWGNGAVNQSAILTASDSAMLDEFGYSVSLDNQFAAIGAQWDDDNGNNSGSIYVFEQPGTGWADMTETAKVSASDGAEYDYLGRSTSISGNVIVSGAPFKDEVSSSEGASYIFSTPPVPEIDVQRPAGTSILDGDTDDLSTILVDSHSLTYTVTNSGLAELTISAPTASNLSNISNFQVTTPPSSPISASGSTTFTISFDVNASGAFSFDISITNDDSDENPYVITIQGTGYELLDYGDAPDPSYPILLSNNGARHTLGSSVYLGTCVDNDTDGQPSATATGDDTAAGTPVYGTCTSNDDEDGVSFTSALEVGATVTMEVAASAQCFLSAWIDFDQNGSWADAGETIFSGQALAAGVNSLSFPIPVTATSGNTFARFRCTTDGAVPFNGAASDGEVEDYQVTISSGLAPVVLFDTYTAPANGTTLFTGPIQLAVSFSEDVKNDASPGAANTTANYALLEAQGDGFNNTDCAAIASTGVDPNDTAIPVNLASYDNNSGAGPFITTLNVNNGQPLPPGTYRLYVCGTTSIEDLTGLELNDGLSDTQVNFTVSAPVSELPDTGFAPCQVSQLPAQPLDAQYADMGSLWLDIPALGIKQNIIGVPQSKDGWDLTWLGNEIGYLNGTAFPTWAGNTVLTGHAYNQNGRPGPFTDLGQLWWGNKVHVHAWGMKYTYEVRSLSLWTKPDKTNAITKHEENDWITLVTCRGYDEKNDTYRWRTVVRAVLINVESE